MPYREPALSALVEFYRSNQKSVTSAIIALLCVIARAFYSGSKWREVTGDIIFCPLIAVLLGNRLPALSIHGFTVDHTIVAAAVGVGGMHMIKLLANWAFERKTGISLKEKNNG
ncbi:TPA: phage holin family protein [Citrobacter gillenii]